MLTINIRLKHNVIYLIIVTGVLILFGRYVMVQGSTVYSAYSRSGNMQHTRNHWL